jgi:hypothetical protein
LRFANDLARKSVLHLIASPPTRHALAVTNAELVAIPTAANHGATKPVAADTNATQL